MSSPDVTSIFVNFMNRIGATSPYIAWAKDHPVDAKKWKTFSDQISLGQNPEPPLMSTGFGKALVQVGVLTMTKRAAGFGRSEFGNSSFSEE